MDYAKKCLDITADIKGHYRLLEQLEAASAFVPQNIAEGNGRFSTKEYIHYLYISPGSLYESITLLNPFARRKEIISKELLNQQEDLALEIVKMLNSLITKLRTHQNK